MSPLEKMDTKLSSIFNTEPIDVDDKNLPATIPAEKEEQTTDDQNIQADSDYIRSNLYSITQAGKEALDYAIELAKQSDSPKAFEAVATLLKNLSDVHLQLLDAHEKKQKLKGKKIQEETPQKVVNNSIVFNGSTADLNKMLQNFKKEQ